MNLSKKLSILIVAFGMGLSSVGCDEFKITLPNESDLESVVLSEHSKKNNIHTTITDNEEIKKIFDDIKSESKKTNKESVSETPTNIENYIELEFLYSVDGGNVSKVNYVYKLKDKYYVEKPYVGIWSITQESYDNIYKLID